MKNDELRKDMMLVGKELL